ncbi:MAG: glycosyltransferase family 2 protein [Burkholderiales bacterium]
MRVSALTVTREGALDRLALAAGDFARQDHADRELVVVHDGSGDFDRSVRALVERLRIDAVVSREASGAPLGALRNRAVALARGEVVAQWDDDDRYHPRRLAIQVEALERERADFAFLADQLHWFPARGTLYWVDWRAEAYPLDFVQGTLVGRRAAMPAYPESRRGEDTAACLAIAASGARIGRVVGAGWCYVYVYHGANAWPESHHAAIAGAKHLPDARLLAREPALREALAGYEPPLPSLVVPCGVGPIAIDPPAHR